MNSAPNSTHRTIALVGAAGSGKTTLAEALLHRAGAIPRSAPWSRATPSATTSPRRSRRGTTLGLSLAYLDWTGPDGVPYAVTLADTPGHPDFVGGVDAALSVADVALIVVSAVDGVTGGHPVRVGGGRGGGRAAHRRRDAGGQGARRLPSRRGRAAARRSASTSGRWSCRSARSRRSTRSPTC